MTDIFISYSRNDVEMVSTLARTLEEMGYSVWWDVSGLHGGQAFAKVIQEKLSEATCCIVIWSESSVKSNWVHSEASFADSRNILLTALYQAVQAPMPFNNRHNEDLRGWNGNVFDDGFQKLIKAVGRLCPVPSGKPLSVDNDTSVLRSPSISEDVQEIARTRSGRLWMGTASLIAVVALGWFLYDKNPSLNSVEGLKIESRSVVSEPMDSPAEESAEVVTQSGVVSKEGKEQLSKVTQLILEKARLALADNRITAPKDNNVKYFIASVLKDYPDNEEALRIITEATSRMQGWAKTEQGNRRFNYAENYLRTSQGLIDQFFLVELQASQTGLANIVKNEKELLAKVKKSQQGSIAEPKKAASKKIYKLANNLTLLPIPAGEFMMGSKSGRNNEKPVHKVTFDKPFWMSKTEITFNQYDEFVTAKGVKKPDDEGWGRGSRPVINVSWNEAQGYLKWLSETNGQGLQCRLPTEAEWEYSARAGSTTKYHWSDSANHEQANYGKDECCEGLAKGRDKWLHTSPVGSFPSNRFGLHDMHGNVWEWVQDTYQKDYIGAPNNGDAWEIGGESRVLRGGSWFNAPGNLRSADRGRNAPDYRNDYLGFRIVCSGDSMNAL